MRFSNRLICFICHQVEMDDAPLTTAEENETELVEEEQQEEESQVISISQLSKGNQLKRREREKESFFYTRERG